MNCVEFNGPTTHDGYGRFKQRLIHRVTWEEANGPVPDGYELHHVCENKLCMNIDHLRLVTRSEHQRLHRWKATCTHGHEMNGDNVHFGSDGRRRCRACASEHSRRYRERMSA